MNKQQKIVLLVSILASFVAFLDGSVINVALPAIVRDLGGGLSVQQWIVDAYLITLGSLILLAGSLSDLFGRKKILLTGLVGFALASVLCAIAPNSLILIISRALQGVAGALLVPSSLAIIISTFSGPLQARAIGIWTAWTGIAFLVGPLLGGFLVDIGSWRWIFAINLLPIAVTIWLLGKIKKDEKAPAGTKVDVGGALLGALGLGLPVYALIEQPNYGWGHVYVYGSMVVGLLALALFVWWEGRTPQPMLPLGLFKHRNFAVGNIATVAIYAGLSIATFLIAVYIQQVGGYSAIEAGMALLPITIIMLFLSSQFGALAGKYGPHLFMTIGPLIGGLGFLLMLRLDTPINYATQLLPGVIVFGLGLATTVAPLTSAILGSIEKTHAGIASAVNNAIARIAGLIAIAAIGVVTGSTLTTAGFHRGIIVTAILLFVGGIVSAFGIKSPRRPKA